MKHGELGAYDAGMEFKGDGSVVFSGVSFFR